MTRPRLRVEAGRGVRVVLPIDQVRGSAVQQHGAAIAEQRRRGAPARSARGSRRKGARAGRGSRPRPDLRAAEGEIDTLAEDLSRVRDRGGHGHLGAALGSPGPGDEEGPGALLRAMVISHVVERGRLRPGLGGRCSPPRRKGSSATSVAGASHARSTSLAEACLVVPSLIVRTTTSRDGVAGRSLERQLIRGRDGQARSRTETARRHRSRPSATRPESTSPESEG